MSKTTTDPIADMLTRIRNAIAVRKNQVVMPHSKIKESVVCILKDTRFIESVKVDKSDVGKSLTVVINNEDSNSKITEIVRISKPGRRAYASAETIPVVKRGRGIVIISTSKGMMTGTQAKKHGIGGELICKVY